MVQEAYFVDIGVPESLRSFEEDVLHNRLTFSLVEKGMPADPGRREP
jgi:NDP-sugar pyrophosphorylase family protein